MITFKIFRYAIEEVTDPETGEKSPGWGIGHGEHTGSYPVETLEIEADELEEAKEKACDVWFPGWREE